MLMTLRMTALDIQVMLCAIEWQINWFVFHYECNIIPPTLLATRKENCSIASELEDAHALEICEMEKIRTS